MLEPSAGIFKHGNASDPPQQFLCNCFGIGFMHLYFLFAVSFLYTWQSIAARLSLGFPQPRL